MAPKHNQRRFTAQRKREIIDRIREWQLMPPDSRIPCTQRELAQELGITPAYVSQILSRTPATVLDSLVEGDTEAMTMHRRIVRGIAEKAAAGDPKFCRMYLELVAQPYRLPKKRESSPMPDVVRRAMELMPIAKIRREKQQASRLATLEAREKKETETNCVVCGTSPCVNTMTSDFIVAFRSPEKVNVEA